MKVTWLKINEIATQYSFIFMPFFIAIIKIYRDKLKGKKLITSVILNSFSFLFGVVGSKLLSHHVPVSIEILASGMTLIGRELLFGFIGIAEQFEEKPIETIEEINELK